MKKWTVEMQKEKLDKRKFQRMVVSDYAFAVCDKKIGWVINISEGGMAIHFADIDFENVSAGWRTVADSISDAPGATIFSSTGVLVKGVPFHFVRKEEIEMPISSIKMHTMAIQFEHLEKEQQELIRQYISGESIK